MTSINNSGLLISKSDEFTKNDNKENKENVLLWLNQSEQMSGYQMTYRGQKVEVRDMPGDVPRKAVAGDRRRFPGYCHGRPGAERQALP